MSRHIPTPSICSLDSHQRAILMLYPKILAQSLAEKLCLAVGGGGRGVAKLHQGLSFHLPKAAVLRTE